MCLAQLTGIYKLINSQVCTFGVDVVLSVLQLTFTEKCLRPRRTFCRAPLSYSVVLGTSASPFGLGTAHVQGIMQSRIRWGTGCEGMLSCLQSSTVPTSAISAVVVSAVWEVQERVFGYLGKRECSMSQFWALIF